MTHHYARRGAIIALATATTIAVGGVVIPAAAPAADAATTQYRAGTAVHFRSELYRGFRYGTPAPGGRTAAPTAAAQSAQPATGAAAAPVAATTAGAAATSATSGTTFAPPRAATTAAASSTAGTSSASSAATPAGWTPEYSEDFATPAATGQVGSVYGQKWLGYSGQSDTSGRGLYAPNSVLSVHDSALDIYLHTENGTHLVAAPMPNGYAGQTYGRFSVRFRADTIPGYKIAFLLWPASGNWNEGEIDFPEGDLGGNAFYGASKIRGGGVNWDPGKPYTPTNASSWHTATIEWTPGSVKWYWDDALIGQTQNPSGVPSTPFRWVLQAETYNQGGTVPNDSSGHVLIDWVKAWTYTP